MRWFLFLLLLPLTLEAQETIEEPEKSQPKLETESEAPAPEKLRNRDINDGLRSFRPSRPSEEIAADNAVGFPVDI